MFEDDDDLLRLEAEAEAEAEFELELEEQERSRNQLDIGGNALQGIKNIPQDLGHMASSTWGFATSPIDTIRQAGAETTARTAGTMASGLAGAGAGATVGSAAGPLGTIVGGGLGFGAGVLGFDKALQTVPEFITDTVPQAASNLVPQGFANAIAPYLPEWAFGDSQTNDPATTPAQDLNRLAYNTSQGAVLGGVGEGAIAVARPVINRTIGPQTRAGVNTEVAQALERTGVTAEQLRNYQPGEIPATTAEVVGTPQMATLQDVIASKLPEQASPYLNRREAVRREVLADIDPGGPGAGTLAENVRQLDQQTRQAADNAAARDIGQPIVPEVAGAELQNAAIAAERAAYQRASSLYDNFNERAVVPLNDTVGRMGEFIRERFPEEARVPPDIRAEMNRLSNPTGEVPPALFGPDGQPIAPPPPSVDWSLGRVQKARSDILKRAAATSDDANRAFYSRLSEELGNAIEEAANSPRNSSLSPADLDAWRTANQQYRAYKEAYRQRAVGDIVKRKGYGEQKLEPSKVPAKIFSSPEAMRQFQDSVGHIPQVQENLRGYVASQVTRDGTVNLQALRQFRRKHEGALRANPPLRASLQNAERTLSALQRLDRSPLRRFMSLEADPLNVTGAIVRMPVEQIRQIRQQIGPQNSGVLGKAIYDYMRDKVLNYKEGFKPETAVNLIRDNAATLQEGLGAHRFQRLERLADNIAREGQIKDMAARTAGGNSMTAQRMQSGAVERALGRTRTLPPLAQRVLDAGVGASAVLGNLTSVPGMTALGGAYGMARLAGRSRNMLQETLAESVFNPTAARGILEQYGTGAPRRARRNPIEKAVGAALGAMQNRSFPSPLTAEIKKAEQPEPVVSEPVPVEPVRGTPKRLSSTSTPFAPQAVTDEELDEGRANFHRTSAIPADIRNLLDTASPFTRAQIMVESSGRPRARSPKGAYGLMQLMPGTAKEMAAKLGEVYRRDDPAQNVRLGEAYFKEMLDRYRDPRLATAAYNYGPTALDRKIAKVGSRNISDLLPHLPEETQNYLRKLSAYI